MTLDENIASTDKGSGLAGTGAVVIWNGITPELREDFFEWHPRQHMVERLSIEGFVRGRRCIALQADVEFLTLYELRTPEVLLTDEYKRRLTNPTAWSSRVLPGFTANTRGACRVLFSQGYAMGAFMATLRIHLPEGRDAILVDAVRAQMADLAHEPRITGAHLLRNDATLTGGNAGNQRGRVIMLPDLVVLVEGSTADGVARAVKRLLSQRFLASHDALPPTLGLYQLEYSIQNLAPVVQPGAHLQAS